MKLKLPAILKNKYVLYAVLFFAITNVLGFLQRKDFESLTIFIAIGLLSTHFSKNMTVNLPGSFDDGKVPSVKFGRLSESGGIVNAYYALQMAEKRRVEGK